MACIELSGARVRRFCFQYLGFSAFTVRAVSWTVAMRARVLVEESPDTVEQLAL
jgi:hypothetical protein